MAVHFLVSKTPDVNWPSDVHEIVCKVATMQRALACKTIDAMQAFIRQRLTIAKDQTATHANQWDAFLHVLFDEPLLEEQDDHLRSSKLRKRSTTQR